MTLSDDDRVLAMKYESEGAAGREVSVLFATQPRSQSFFSSSYFLWSSFLVRRLPFNL